ncbi:MAG: hypothetical protein H6709_10250 [Kofleriaceae bacterium]|nr:hypothetical protein [Kofleriaceae bacterium]MCB9572456.1 hypothetical protein [Kofleriaceae bacterium]
MSRPRRRVAVLLALVLGLGAAAAAAAVALIVHRSARRAAAPPADARGSDDGWRYVPLDGWHGDKDGDPFAAAGRCAELVDTVITYPNWVLDIADKGAGCAGDWENAHFAIHATGEVTWTADQLPTRTLWLTPDELARVRGLNRHDCASEPDRYAGGALYYELSWGGGDGVRIHQESALGAEIDAILSGPVGRYDAARLAAVAPVRIELAGRSIDATRTWTRRGAAYQIVMDDDGAITVTRRGKPRHHARVDVRARVDLIDALLDGHGATPAELDLARGRAVLGDRTVTFAVDFMTRDPALQPLARALDYAVFAPEE